MHELVFYAATIWMTVLLGATVVLVVRARSATSRILAVDMLVLILIALLVLFSDSRRVAYYLDAALMMAVISFIATLAASRYSSQGRIF